MHDGPSQNAGNGQRARSARPHGPSPSSSPSPSPSASPSSNAANNDETATTTAHGDLSAPTAAPPQPLDEALRERQRAFQDTIAATRAAFRERNAYYHELLLQYLRFIILPGSRVLELGCGDGVLLRQLEPSHGVGIDFSPVTIARARAGLGLDTALTRHDGRLTFIEGDAETVPIREHSDYVVMSDLLGDLLDIQRTLDNVRSACSPATRIVLTYHSMLWEPWLRLAQWLGLKCPQKHHNWLSLQDLLAFARLSDFEVVHFERRILCPVRIPWLAAFLNRFIAALPLINALCLLNLAVLRRRPRPAVHPLSTSVLIPCRNERGNIEPAVQRLPAFGRSQEIIFVDGHSTDGTRDEIERVISAHPDKNIRLIDQHGVGKGDAVRLGFAQATGEVLMILDADLTVAPEELPKFYDAIASGKGEFINGSRLVYPMESEAMRPLNVLGNKFFSVAISWTLGQRLKDTLCGVKVLRRSDYENIAAARGFFGELDPFGDFDLLFGATKQNLKIVELPIRYRARTYGVTNISRFTHGWLLLRMTVLAARKFRMR